VDYEGRKNILLTMEMGYLRRSAILLRMNKI
jgi:hypothetical protein